jgi:hypothetical protein
MFMAAILSVDCGSASTASPNDFASGVCCRVLGYRSTPFFAFGRKRPWSDRPAATALGKKKAAA